MNLIFYTAHENDWAEIYALIEPFSFIGDIEVCRSMASLSCGIKHKDSDNLIAILLSRHHWELIRIARLADRLRDLKVILVLPDRDPQTIALAHTLYPRFISYADNGLQDVRSVLLKMITHHQTNYVPMNQGGKR